MKGTLYGVGVGPGDPSLLTLKAIACIQAAAVVAVPDSGSEQAALKIVQEYIGGKEILYCPMPMTRDEAVKQAAHEAGADRIASQLDQGRDVAFVTLGDPSIYSTYIYLHRIMLARGYDAQLIPGIPSFCAAAAELNMPLCEKEQPLHILPGGTAEGWEDLPGTRVLMKIGKRFEQTAEKLKAHGLYERASLVENCGMESERLFRSLSELSGTPGSFSIIIVKDGEDA